VLTDPTLDDLMRGELISLPGEAYLAEQFLLADPGAIRREREALKAAVGSAQASQLASLHHRASAVPYSLDKAARGARKIKTQALVWLAAGDPQTAARLAAAQFDAADNMTDQQGALMVLAGLDSPLRADKLAAFHQRFADNALVIDKWFSLQAGSLHPGVLEHVRALANHPDFTLGNPNRVRALYMAMAVNPGAFHAADGAGYRMIADLILTLDPRNAQTAARFVAPLGRWRRIEAGRAGLMRAELERIAKAPGLSRDTSEQVGKSLG
jgi:aminopeptidase N